MRGQFLATIGERIASRLRGAKSPSPFDVQQEIAHHAIEVLGYAGVDRVDEIVAAAKAAWDKYFVPLDLPGIPNAIEPMVESLMWNTLEAMIRSLAARMRKNGLGSSEGVATVTGAPAQDGGQLWVTGAQPVRR